MYNLMNITHKHIKSEKKIRVPYFADYRTHRLIGPTPYLEVKNQKKKV